MQHWLKVLHRFSGGANATVGDPHRLGSYGEPVMRPAYEPGDLALVYIAGTYRCPAVVEITGEAAFDSGQRRCSESNSAGPRSSTTAGHR